MCAQSDPSCATAQLIFYSLLKLKSNFEVLCNGFNLVVTDDSHRHFANAQVSVAHCICLEASHDLTHDSYCTHTTAVSCLCVIDRDTSLSHS